MTGGVWNDKGEILRYALNELCLKANIWLIIFNIFLF